MVAPRASTLVIVPVTAGFRVYEMRDRTLTLVSEHQGAVTPSSFDMSPKGDRIIAKSTGLFTIGTIVFAWLATRLVGTLRTALREIPHSRIPVADGSVDNIVGVVQARDLLTRALDGQPLDLGDDEALAGLGRHGDGEVVQDVIDVVPAGRDGVAPGRFVGQPVLDRALACAPGLDLQPALPGVDVRARAYLEPGRSPVRREPVAVQVWGVEVDGPVAEDASALDLQDAL